VGPDDAAAAVGMECRRHFAAQEFGSLAIWTRWPKSSVIIAALGDEWKTPGAHAGNAAAIARIRRLQCMVMGTNDLEQRPANPRCARTGCRL